MYHFFVYKFKNKKPTTYLLFLFQHCLASTAQVFKSRQVLPGIGTYKMSKGFSNTNLLKYLNVCIA